MGILIYDDVDIDLYIKLIMHVDVVIWTSGLIDSRWMLSE